MNKVYIVAAKRTPIGKFNGSLSAFTAAELGAKVMSAVIKQSNLPPELIDQVLMGNVLQAGQGQNPARKASRIAGLPISVPAITVNDVCGSGLTSINMGMSLILSGQAECVLAGGMESMSNAPYLLDRARFGYRMGNGILLDSMLEDSLVDSIGKYHMGVTAENIVEKYGITRKQMDTYSVESHKKATNATDLGKFTNEIVELEIATREGTSIISKDEGIRENSSVENLSKLKGVFKDEGTVSAGNSSSINDGAAAVLMVSESLAEKYGLTPLVEVLDSAIVGLEPEFMGLGPVYAIRKLLAQNNLEVSDIDIFELNEAFASQSIACSQELSIDAQKLNPKGGAIALGHPVGASGSRILTTLIYEMLENNAKLGVASLCVGGGMGISTLLRAIS